MTYCLCTTQPPPKAGPTKTGKTYTNHSGVFVPFANSKFVKNAIINAVIQKIVIKVNPFFGPFLSIYFPTGYVNATAPIIPIPNTINTGPESPNSNPI